MASMMTRRSVLLAASGSVLAATGVGQDARAAGNALAFTFARIGGGEIRLRELAGQPFMVVNTASHCGFTGQFAGLQQLWTRFRPRGFTLIGVPANDFAGQEPGSDADILGFCTGTFGVTFPMASKSVVVGDQAHPFYRWAAAERPADRPRWNFHKYLIGRDGRIAAAFPTSMQPTDPQVIAAVERALAGSSAAS
jgi:glutathione peroxidase